MTFRRPTWHGLWLAVAVFILVALALRFLT